MTLHPCGHILQPAEWTLQWTERTLHMGERILHDEGRAGAMAMREAGMTDKAIAAKLNVSAKTIRRLLGSRRGWQREMRGRREAVGEQAQADWPAEREWPETRTREWLIETAGWHPEAAERTFRAVQEAQRRGNRWLPWYFRSAVELALEEAKKDKEIRLPNDSNGRAWRDLLSGLPVLEVWLGGAPEVGELRQLVLDYAPYIPTWGRWRPVKHIIGNITRGAQRRQYAGAARPHVEALKRRVDGLALESHLLLPLDDPGPFRALSAIVERLPMVDLGPWRYDGRPTSLWQLFARVFSFNPLGGE